MAITTTLSGSVGADVGIFEVYYNSACYSGSDGGPITGSTEGVARLFSGSETSPYDFEYSIDFPDDAYEAYIRTLGASGSNGISGSIYCSQCFGPVALPGVEPPAPPAPPATPLYSLTSNKSQVNEGDSFIITLTTDNVTLPTSVQYDITGDVEAADTDPNGTNVFFLDSAGEGTATKTFTAIADSTTEGDETFTLSLANTSASIDVTIKDTSLTPPTPSDYQPIYLYANFAGGAFQGLTDPDDYCDTTFNYSIKFDYSGSVGNPRRPAIGERILTASSPTTFNNSHYFAYGGVSGQTGDGQEVKYLQVQSDGTISSTETACGPDPGEEID